MVDASNEYYEGVSLLCSAIRKGGRWRLRVSGEGWFVKDFISELVSSGSLVVESVNDKEVVLRQREPLLE